MDIRIGAGRPLRGAPKIPGDKSISHRGLLLSSLAKTNCEIENLAPGLDVRSTARCLTTLGVEVKWKITPVGTSAQVYGRGLRSWQESDKALDCGNSGTTMRLMAGPIAGQGLHATLKGDASLSRRPMGRILDPLRRMGARVSGTKEDEHNQEVAPLHFSESPPLHGIDYALPVASAQIKSCLILAGLYAKSPCTLIEPARSRDHTEIMLKAAGVAIRRDDLTLTVHPFEEDALAFPGHLTIPGDPSSAAFLIAASILSPDSEIILENINANPTRTGFLAVLRRMGADVEIHPQSHDANESGGEPTATIIARHTPELQGTVIEESEIPSLVDEIPILSILGARARGQTWIRGAGELRVKESDRLAAISRNLRAMGAELEEHEDSLVLGGESQLRGASIETFGDHRIALSFAVAGLIAEGTTEIRGAECVDVSYPDFFRTLAQLTR